MSEYTAGLPAVSSSFILPFLIRHHESLAIILRHHFQEYVGNIVKCYKNKYNEVHIAVRTNERTIGLTSLGRAAMKLDVIRAELQNIFFNVNHLSLH